MMNNIRLIETLTNCTAWATLGNHEQQLYGKGVLVGVVGTFMELENASFETAVAMICDIMREHKTWDIECIPESWRSEFMKYPQDDIVHGNNSGWSCPIALSLKRRFPE